ncbi:MAG: NADH-quinone oxidoreductase subunit NuoH [Acidobacteria bacterium]|nr:NADH-quinone oxidoreductase subunit NuoH [Acidobacteriota bacterium]
MSFDLLATLAKTALWMALLLQVTPIMVWVERRGSAMIQDRLGPNRVGPFGLFQSLADAVKFLCKEDITPVEADKFMHGLAPVLALIPALTTFVVIPFGPDVTVLGHRVPLVVAGAETGVLLLLALASLGVYSLVMAGYSSNNKYSMLGAVRASAQLISYELALTLAVLAVLMPVGSFELNEVVRYQQGSFFGLLPRWNVIPQFIGFLVFVVAAFAETNRLPFDLPEAESELVAGYHTEYSSMKFALFFMGEYMGMATLSCLAATLYLGGWHLPGLSYSGPWWWVAAQGMGVLVAKATLFLFFFVWVRWTFPRFRFDQLMRLGWKVLLPLSILNLIAVAALTVAGVL